MILMAQSDMELPDNPNEVIDLVAQRLREFDQNPTLDRFEWLTDVAEMLVREGLGGVARQLFEVCRRIVGQVPEAGRARARAGLDRSEGLHALNEGRLDDAERLLLSAVENHEDLGDPVGSGIAHQNLALLYWEKERLPEARTESLRALEGFEEAGDRLRQAQVIVNLASFDLEEGDSAGAARRLDEAEGLAAGQAGRFIRLSILGTRAHIARLEGDLAQAGDLYRQIVNRLRRGAFAGQARIATQNLGAWYAEMAKPKLAALWLGRAAALASVEGNRRLAARLMRSQALQLRAIGVVSDATSMMRMAIAVSSDHDDLDGIAQGRADLAAILLSSLEYLPPDERSGSRETLAEADELLDLALEYFGAAGDTTWRYRVEDNAISLSLLRGTPSEAIDRVRAARESARAGDRHRRLELDRRGAAIAAADARRPELAASFIRNASEEAAQGVGEPLAPVPGRDDLEVTGDAAAAWELAVGADQLRLFSFALPVAIELFREGQELARSDQTLFFHITNDLGSTYAQLGDDLSAVACFDICLGIAEAQSDRVLRRQALGNRGEMARRIGEPDAIAQLTEAVQLARDLGDVAAETESQLNLSLAYLDSGNARRAEAIVRRAAARIEEDELGTEVRGNAEAVQGVIAATRRDFSRAYEHYEEASRLLHGPERIDAMVAALLALASNVQAKRYRRWLQKAIMVAQSERLDGYVAVGLTRAAETCLDVGSYTLGADTYQAAILLALNQVGRDLPVIGGEVQAMSGDETADIGVRLNPFYEVIMRLAVALERRPDLRQKVLVRIRTGLRKAVGEPSDELVIEWIDQAIAVGHRVAEDLGIGESGESG